MRIGQHAEDPFNPKYFIADIGSNHEGSLARAKEPIWVASEVDADYAESQYYRDAHLVSDRDFQELGTVASHQRSWSALVYEVYSAASVPWEWTDTLAEAAALAGVDFMSTPCDLEALECLSPHQPAVKNRFRGCQLAGTPGSRERFRKTGTPGHGRIRLCRC